VKYPGSFSTLTLVSSPRAQDRDFLPSLQGYFEEAIEQCDPASGVEEEYKKVNNGEWGWRALRLMSR
jgi:THO complex subunit 1